MTTDPRGQRSEALSKIEILSMSNSQTACSVDHEAQEKILDERDKVQAGRCKGQMCSEIRIH